MGGSGGRGGQVHQINRLLLLFRGSHIMDRDNTINTSTTYQYSIARNNPCIVEFKRAHLTSKAWLDQAMLCVAPPLALCQRRDSVTLLGELIVRRHQSKIEFEFRGHDLRTQFHIRMRIKPRAKML